MNFLTKKLLILTFSFLMITNAVIYASDITSTDDNEFLIEKDQNETPLDTSDVLTSGNYEYVADSSGVYITAYTGSETIVTIPSIIEGKSVLMIYSEAFSYCDTVEKVIIPETVNSIYEDAFINCSTIECIEVDKNNTVYASDNGILYDKDYQYLVICPPGKSGTVDVVDGCIYVCDYSFFECSNITEVDIPSSVIDIAVNAFLKTSALTTINIDSANTSYKMRNGILYGNIYNETTESYDYGLVKCLETKTGNVSMLSGITKIADYAFYNCTGITGSIVIPSSVKEIGEFAFGNCISLNGTVTFYDTLTTIGRCAFYNCESLTGINFANGLEEIPERCFAYCKSLTSIEIPDSVETIGECAFFDCTSVKSLTLGESVKTIEAWAFSWLTSLEGDLIIPDSVETIGDAAFAESENIDGYIVIGSGVLEMGNSVFYRSENAKGIVFKGNAPTISEYTFLKPDVTLYRLSDKYGFESGYYLEKNVEIYSLNPVITYISQGKTYKTVTLSSYGQSVEEFDPPTYEDLKFVVWCYDEELTQEYSFSDTFMNDTTLYVKTDDKNKLYFDSDEVEIEIREGGTLEVGYSLEEGATYDDISWSSSDETIATVDENGNVTGVSVGQTTITATYKKASASITVIIWKDTNKLSFNDEAITIEAEEEQDLDYNYHFIDDATVDDIVWTSSDTSVVTVASGKITAISEGMATITCQYEEATASIDVIVLKKNTITILDNTFILKEGVTQEISFDYYFNDGATEDDIVWTTSNSNVAKVSNGVITTKLDGEAVITATYKNASASVRVIVTKPDKIQFSVSSLTLNNDVGTYSLSYTWYSYGKTEEDIVWLTSNASVVTVNNGVITINGCGTATITAAVGDATATITIEIIKLDILDKSIELRYNKGEAIDLDIDYYFNDGATEEDIVFTSSNESVVAVEGNTLIQKGIGDAVVTASYSNVSDCVDISIIPQDNITFSKYGYMIKPDETIELDYTYYFYQLAFVDIEFTSSNEEVATVDENGNVTAISEGEATITAKCADISAEVKIVVTDLEYLRGDMNFDGFVNSTDAAMLLDKYKNGDAETLDYIVGDLSEDNFLNSTDAAMILDIFKN